MRATDVFIFTENYPPYNYPAADGGVAGDATDRVRQVMAESGLSFEITIAPWARAVRFTETADNVLIYSIARIPNRDKRFHWLVPLANDTYHLFSRKTDPRDFPRDQILAGAFSVVCVAGDISCVLLRESGIPERAILRTVALDQPGTLKMVEAGRVDMFPGSMINYQSDQPHTGAWKETFRPVFDLEIGLTLYLAAGANTRPDIMDKVGQAYQRLTDRNAYSLMAPGAQE